MEGLTAETCCAVENKISHKIDGYGVEERVREDKKEECLEKL